MAKAKRRPVARKRSWNPPGVPAPIRGYYSNCVKVEAGPLLFVSGQVALDTKGRVVGAGNPAKQAEQTLKNIQTILKANGARMADVVQVIVYVTDIRYLDMIKKARLKHWPKGGPSSAIVEVGALAFPELLVEISAVAAPAH
ncbi:MAG: RidA family protein [Alphaproteobacteria bacterium]